MRSYTLTPDSDAHSACHRLEKAILEGFLGSELHVFQHDPHGAVCRYDGKVVFEDSSYTLSFQQNGPTQIEMKIDVGEVLPDDLFDTMLAAYASKLDAGGNSHSLQLKPALNNPH